jgi:hypothetical protein
MRFWHVALLIGIAVVVAAVMLRNRDPQPLKVDAGKMEHGGPGGDPKDQVTNRPSRDIETRGPGHDSTASEASEWNPLLFGKRREALLKKISELSAALRLDREAGDTETEAEENIRKKAWSRLTRELASMVRADPRQADVMVAEMDATSEEALAIRLARILRYAEHPELLQEMKERVTNGSTPLQRRTAMLVLETRNHALWLDPVSTAYISDGDVSVRDEAGGVLARSLADRKHLSVHNRMRATIQVGLDSNEPEVRIRSLRTMLGDRRPRPTDLERAKAMLDDKNGDVRRAAVRTVRVLNSILYPKK